MEVSEKGDTAEKSSPGSEIVIEGMHGCRFRKLPHPVVFGWTRLYWDCSAVAQSFQILVHKVRSRKLLSQCMIPSVHRFGLVLRGRIFLSPVWVGGLRSPASLVLDVRIIGPTALAVSAQQPNWIQTNLATQRIPDLLALLNYDFDRVQRRGISLFMNCVEMCLRKCTVISARV